MVLIHHKIKYAAALKVYLTSVKGSVSKYSLVVLSVVFILLLGHIKTFFCPPLVISFLIHTLMFSHHLCTSSIQQTSI